MSDLKLRTEHYGAGDQSWLASRHGVENARTITIKRSALTEGTDFPKGYLPSGFPLSKDTDGKYVPYESGKGLAGFLVTDQSTLGGGDLIAPLLWHGSVVTTKLPVPFTPPASTAFTFI